MRKVTLYQATTESAFRTNMMAMVTGVFAPMEEMEAVVMLRMDGEVEDILDELFYRMNSEEYRYSLSYSMSVGDVVDIDGVRYRCAMVGWDLIQ